MAPDDQKVGREQTCDGPNDVVQRLARVIDHSPTASPPDPQAGFERGGHFASLAEATEWRRKINRLKFYTAQRLCQQKHRCDRNDTGG